MGSHVVVRPLRRDDAVSLYAFVMQQRDGLNRDQAGAASLVGKLLYEEKTLVAVDRDNVVGIVSLDRGKKPSDRHVAQLRIHLRPEYRASGLGSKMMRRMKFWADRNGIERIIATPYVQRRYLEPLGRSVYANGTGRKVSFFAKHGFMTEGIMRNAARLADGSLTDVALMARTR